LGRCGQERLERARAGVRGRRARRSRQCRRHSAGNLSAWWWRAPADAGGGGLGTGRRAPGARPLGRGEWASQCASGHAGGGTQAAHRHAGGAPARELGYSRRLGRPGMTAAAAGRWVQRADGSSAPKAKQGLGARVSSAGAAARRVWSSAGWAVWFIGRLRVCVRTGVGCCMRVASGCVCKCVCLERA
jgi:hypothetical protein